MHGSHSMIPVYQERGVYNVYFRLLARDRNPIYLTEETDEQDRVEERFVRGLQRVLTRAQRVEMAEAENRRRGDITDTWEEYDEQMTAAEAATDSP